MAQQSEPRFLRSLLSCFRPASRLHYSLESSCEDPVPTISSPAACTQIEGGRSKQQQATTQRQQCHPNTQQLIACRTVENKGAVSMYEDPQLHGRKPLFLASDAEDTEYNSASSSVDSGTCSVPQSGKPPASLQVTLFAYHVREIALDDPNVHIKRLKMLAQGPASVVYRGIWQGMSVAVKLVVYKGHKNAQELQIAARELLIGSSPPVYDHLARTYSCDVAEVVTDSASQPGSSPAPALCLRPVQTNILAPGVPADVHHFHFSSNIVPACLPLPAEDTCTGSGSGGNSQQAVKQLLSCLGAQPGDHLVHIIMELATGGNLQHAISAGMFERSGKLDSHSALQVLTRTCREIADGMCLLHEKGIVHGALQPSNVLLQRSRANKRGFTAKLADFGLAHLLASQDSALAHTGHSNYTAPEVLSGQAPQAASDVYSFGVLLWQMLTGAAPFSEVSGQSVSESVSSGGVRLVWPKQVHAPLRKLGEDCLSLDPALRPSFSDVSKSLVLWEKSLRRIKLQDRFALKEVQF